MSQAANQLLTGLANARIHERSSAVQIDVPRDGTGRFTTIRRAMSTTREFVGGTIAVIVLAGGILSVVGALDAAKLFTYFDIGGARAYEASAPTEEYIRALYNAVVAEDMLTEGMVDDTDAQTVSTN
jgi:hypothetical protein